MLATFSSALLHAAAAAHAARAPSQKHAQAAPREASAGPCAFSKLNLHAIGLLVSENTDKGCWQKDSDQVHLRKEVAASLELVDADANPAAHVPLFAQLVGRRELLQGEHLLQVALHLLVNKEPQGSRR